MYIKSLSLTNFRNYKKETIEFSKDKNVLYGKNGQGKTNIIEALFFLQSGKSYRCLKDKEVIRFGEEFSKTEIEFVHKNELQKAEFFIADQKTVKLNGIVLERLSELIGNMNIVIFTPDHLNLIKDGPGVRRQFLDSFISQLKPVYFQNLIQYYRILKQRNNLLKSHNLKMLSTLEIWNEKMAQYAVKICAYRKRALDKINETINLINIDENNESIQFEYTPSIKGDFTDTENILKQMERAKEKELEKGITLIGPHRDDFEITMNGENIKKYGSQGQQRTCILKLKLSECEIIKDLVGEEPVLLLDDILSELDAIRRNFFIENIQNKQVIITCTDKEFLKGSENRYFKVKNGTICKEG